MWNSAPYPDRLTWLSRASIGIHTMVDEHFGINVVPSFIIIECELIWIGYTCYTRFRWAFSRYRHSIQWTNHGSYSLHTSSPNQHLNTLFICFRVPRDNT